MRSTVGWGMFALGWSLCWGAPAQAALRIVATTTDLAAIASEVGGEHVSAESITRGTQDPHSVEPKPSFMVKVARADLVISIGLDLEIGWLPSILRGARNPRVNPGQKGHLEVGTQVERLEVAGGSVSRAQGDVHPQGNPHILLDPIRAGTIALVIAKRLGELDPEHASVFQGNATALQSRWRSRTAEWKSRITRSGVKKVITYHRTLSYFLDRFGLANPAILEPKPGIPPTSGHIISVIETIRREKVPLVLVENYFDPSVTRKIAAEVPSIRVATVPVAVDGAAGLAKLDDLYEALVKAIEGGRPGNER